MLDANGTVLTTPEQLPGVAVSGVNDIETSVSDLSDFFGTSCATPSVAAVAALMLQANPQLTPAGVEAILEYTAIPLTTDPAVSGAGLVQAEPAVALAQEVAAEPPVLSGAGNSVSYVIGGAAVVIDSGLTISDPLFTSLAGATVSIVNSSSINNGLSLYGSFSTDDVLSATTAGTDISESYNSATGVLTLTGGDTLADYEKVLNSVTFSSTAEDPTDYGADLKRTISWVVSDVQNSISVTSTVDINGTVYTGIYVTGIVLSNASTQNPALIDPSGFVTNNTTANFGNAIVGDSGTAWTVANFGTIEGTGTSSDGVWLQSGGSVTNGASGTASPLVSGVVNGVQIDAATGSVSNFGTITGTGTGGSGIYLRAGGNVANGASGSASAVISGVLDGVAIGHEAGIVSNFGAITGGLYGIEISAATGTVTNFGSITGTGTTGVGIFLTAGGSVANGASGPSSASISGVLNGIEIAGATGIVTNFGAIEGTGISGAGIFLTAGGSVANGASGSTSALISGVLNGVAVNTSAGTVTNFGTVAGTGTAGAGIFLTAGGSVANGASGSVGAKISGGHNGVEISGAAGTITNFGTVTGSGVAGIYLASGTASDTIISSGVIQGVTGITVAAGDTAGNTLTNAGTIIGTDGTAVAFGAGNDVLTVAAGAVFTGAVEGGGGSNKLVQGAHGTLNVTGFSGFGTIVLAKGGADSLTLINANFTGITGSPPSITIDGGNDGNTINAATLTGTDRIVAVGGAGEDVFTGGAGNDIFRFSAANLCRQRQRRRRWRYQLPGNDDRRHGCGGRGRWGRNLRAGQYRRQHVDPDRRQLHRSDQRRDHGRWRQPGQHTERGGGRGGGQSHSQGWCRHRHLDRRPARSDDRRRRGGCVRVHDAGLDRDPGPEYDRRLRSWHRPDRLQQCRVRSRAVRREQYAAGIANVMVLVEDQRHLRQCQRTLCLQRDGRQSGLRRSRQYGGQLARIGCHLDRPPHPYRDRPVLRLVTHSAAQRIGALRRRQGWQQLPVEPITTV